MRTLKALSFIQTALLLFTLSGCAVPIKNFTACALVPGDLGAVCDDFLQSNQQILTEDQWKALMAQWNASGSAVECTTSEAIGNLKDSVEKLCSRYPCDEQVKKTLIDGLGRVRDTKTEAIK